MKYTPKQLRALNKKFAPLTYADKLKFWDKHFSDLNGFYNFYSTIFFDDVADTERMKPENFISIYPKGKQETEQYNRWFLNSIQCQPHYNFEKLKEKYFHTITNNPRAVEYIEQEIEAIKTHRDKAKKNMDERKDIRLWGYYFGYQSVVQNNDATKQIDADKFNSIGLQCAKGIADAHYLNFLEKQLEQLKQGKEILLQQKESNTETQPKNFSGIKPVFTPLKLEQIPANIYSAYFSKGNEPLFHSLEIEGQPIPIFRIVLDLEKKYKPRFKEMHLAEYAKGFTEAMKHEFAPTINTPENIKEMVLTEVQNGSQFGFPERVKDSKKQERYFDAKDVYEYGFRVGKVYKAWSIIFETPKYFEDGFPKLKADKSKAKFTLPQLALFLFYNGQTVTRINGNEIAKQYGHNSGEKLFQLFTKFSSRANRIGKEDTKKKNQNKLELFGVVIAELTSEAKHRATDEMNTLNATVQREHQ